MLFSFRQCSPRKAPKQAREGAYALSIPASHIVCTAPVITGSCGHFHPPPSLEAAHHCARAATSRPAALFSRQNFGVARFTRIGSATMVGIWNSQRLLPAWQVRCWRPRQSAAVRNILSGCGFCKAHTESAFPWNWLKLPSCTLFGIAAPDLFARLSVTARGHSNAEVRTAHRSGWIVLVALPKRSAQLARSELQPAELPGGDDACTTYRERMALRRAASPPSCRGLPCQANLQLRIQPPRELHGRDLHQRAQDHV